MATLDRFEELIAWKKARELNRLIYQLTRCEPLSKDWALCNQLRRASISVISNIAEGFERGGRKEFIQFLSISKGSVGEIPAQLIVALDVAYIDQATFEFHHGLADDVGRIIGGLIRYLQNSDIAGPKYLTDKPTA
jgi:four helix bundle protein